jgi:hypothetical protein
MSEREVSDEALLIKSPSREGEAPTEDVRAGGVRCFINRQVVMMTILIKKCG